MSGYTHGIMTIRVPEQTAKKFHSHCRTNGVAPDRVIAGLLAWLEDREFIGLWSEDNGQPAQNPHMGQRTETENADASTA